MAKLKPCPNPSCPEKNDVWLNTSYGCYVYCKSCKMIGPHYLEPKDAIEGWNELPRNEEP